MTFDSVFVSESGMIALPDVTRIDAFSDTELLEALRAATVGRRRFDAVVVSLTGELARRSDRSRGQEGLAARLGSKDAEQAIQSLTGVTRSEAKALTTVADAERAPWLAPVSGSVGVGTLSVAEGAAIAGGLGAPSADVSPDDLRDAARRLVDAAKVPGVTPEALNRSARRERERLEADRITDVEEYRRSKRSLSWFELPDGMTKLTAILDPESAAIVTSAIDTALSPRRTGPRFIDESTEPLAAVADTPLRTRQQRALDTLVDIVTLAARAAHSDLDPDRLFGATSPAVRVHVPLDVLVNESGAGWIEGQSSAISAATAARHVCTSGVLPVLLDGNQPIDAGRAHRLHSVRQRIALAAQWGGCAWGQCTTAPAMTEVHHMRAFDGTNTTLDNGIPLCRFHHLQLHNGRWRIESRTDPHEGTTYWLLPPPTHPHARTPMRLVPRSRASQRAHAG